MNGTYPDRSEHAHFSVIDWANNDTGIVTMCLIRTRRKIFQATRYLKELKPRINHLWRNLNSTGLSQQQWQLNV
jgi:hypothetical protein